MIGIGRFKSKAEDYIGRESVGEIKTYFSPGRVNLIGEHLDYNGGHVLPCALNLGNSLAIRLRADTKIRAFSASFPDDGELEASVEELLEQTELSGKWFDYLVGGIRVLNKHGKQIKRGFDLYILGDLPGGAGLSSSASISCGIIYALSDSMGLELTLREVALYAKEIENDYIGVSCGYMDFFAVVFSKKSHALYFDTDNLEFENVPMDLGAYRIVISNTNKRRELRDSDYNDRRKSCSKAELILGKSLALVDKTHLETYASSMEPNIYMRASYVIQEEMRTKNAVEALANRNIAEFAELMIDSHEGLKNKFQVTGFELDTLQELALKYGALGSRMTGAGFGGCVVSLVEKDKVQDFMNNTSKEYFKRVSYEPTHYLPETANGVGRLEE